MPTRGATSKPLAKDGEEVLHEKPVEPSEEVMQERPMIVDQITSDLGNVKEEPSKYRQVSFGAGWENNGDSIHTPQSFLSDLAIFEEVEEDWSEMMIRIFSQDKLLVPSP